MRVCCSRNSTQHTTHAHSKQIQRQTHQAADRSNSSCQPNPKSDGKSLCSRLCAACTSAQPCAHNKCFGGVPTSSRRKLHGQAAISHTTTSAAQPTWDMPCH